VGLVSADGRMLFSFFYWHKKARRLSDCNGKEHAAIQSTNLPMVLVSPYEFCDGKIALRGSETTCERFTNFLT
jgi:hypothetical protein